MFTVRTVHFERTVRTPNSLFWANSSNTEQAKQFFPCEQSEQFISSEQSEHQKFWKNPNRPNSPNTYCSELVDPGDRLHLLWWIAPISPLSARIGPISCDTIMNFTTCVIQLFCCPSDTFGMSSVVIFTSIHSSTQKWVLVFFAAAGCWKSSSCPYDLLPAKLGHWSDSHSEWPKFNSPKTSC